MATQNEAELKPQQPRHKWLLRSLVKSGLFVVSGVLVIVALGFAQRQGWISSGGGHAASSDAEAASSYICPMMCTPPQETPGRCPVCGMELVAAVASSGPSDGISIHLEPAARRLAHIQTVAAQATPLKRKISAVGAIAYDEGTQATIASYFDARIERLFADYTGVRVHAGEHMALVYSPALYSAQVELVQALHSLESTSDSSSTRMRYTQLALIDGARHKLTELGMTEQQIRELEESGDAQTRMHICAPISGTVVEKLAVQGQYVTTGQPIYRLADLSTVWLMLELFPEDAAYVRYGQQVEIEVASYPGRRFNGRVAFSDPVVDASKRTVGVRVVLPNERGLLRPGDYATAHIEVDVLSSGDTHEHAVYDEEMAGKFICPRHPHVLSDSSGHCEICGTEQVSTQDFGFSDISLPPRTAVTVPRSAVLMCGRQSVVYVETEPGRFEIRSVVLGAVLDQQAVILEGVSVGEEVATSGNFLIDSQMQLSGNPSLIDPSRAQVKKEGPLELDRVDIVPIEGEAGARLELLYEAYFQIQATLASDSTVSTVDLESLATQAQGLVASADLPAEAMPFVQTMAEASVSLRDKPLDAQRVEFKSLSKAVLHLASRVRGSEAEGSLLHFYCSMVPEGEGDWLQAGKPLMNPYWGSQMLHCGREVHQFPPRSAESTSDPMAEREGHDRAAEEGEAMNHPATPTTPENTLR